MNNKAIFVSFTIAAVALFVIVFAFAYLFLTTDPNQGFASTQQSIVLMNSTATPVVSIPDETQIVNIQPTTEIVEEHLPNTPRIIAPENYAVFYVMGAGDKFSKIAEEFGGSEDDLRKLNEVDTNDWFYNGSIIRIRPESEGHSGYSFDILPEAELVNSPNSIGFDLSAFVYGFNGFLASYAEDITGLDDKVERVMTGIEIVDKVSSDYSVNSRLLLALIEYQTTWVTNPNPPEWTREKTFGLGNSDCETFYCQLAWAADRMNWGYYSWKQSEISHLRTQDNQLIKIDSNVSAGTVGVQNYFAFYHDFTYWEKAVASTGIAQTYRTFFDDPFSQGIEVAVPMGLTQPQWTLPFEENILWVYTGGPHAGWGNGTNLAALDFAPAGGTGCYDSDRWVVSVSDGVIVDLDEGLVLVDVDVDGLMQTGWTIQYMHIAEAVESHQIGEVLKQGDRIGHPSCEGGYSTGTHVHVARMFQGEWMDAGGPVPFVLDGWQAYSVYGKYDGYLQKGNQILSPYQSGFEVDENYLITK